MTKIKAVYLGGLRTECTHLQSGAKIETDAPLDNQGRGEEFSPTDLFAAGLATCMMTSMAIAARQLGIDLKGISVELEKEMLAAPHRRIGRLVIRFRSSLSLNVSIREKLERTATECPVMRSLHPDIKLEIDFVWGL